MSDHEHAETALAALERIDGADHDEDVRDAYQNAIGAVDELVEMLAGEDGDVIEVEAPDGWDDEDEWKERVEEARGKGEGHADDEDNRRARILLPAVARGRAGQESVRRASESVVARFFSGNSGVLDSLSSIYSSGPE